MVKLIKIVFAVLLVIAVVAFFYKTYNNSNDLGVVIAKVNDQEIYSNEVLAIQQITLSQGRSITKESALTQIINKELIFQEAKKQGYYPSIEEAETNINLQLQGQNMTLDDYKNRLISSGKKYENELTAIRGEIAIQDYLDSQINESMLIVTDAEAREFYEDYKSKIPGEISSFEESKDQIIKTLKIKKQREAIDILINGLKVNATIEYF